MILLVVMSLLTNKIDEWTFSKSDVEKDLKHIDVELRHDFKIIANRVSGMPERYQQTKLLIAPADRNRIIGEIKNSANFKSFENSDLTSEDNEVNREIRNEIYNYRYPEFYSRNTYTYIDNIPARFYMSISENNDTLEYQLIED